MTYFTKIGGAPAVEKIVEEFSARMESLPEARAVREMHAEDLAKTKAIMKRYFSELLGGPMQFSEERGHPGLKVRHTGMLIGASERNAWMRCMSEALATAVPDEATRNYIEERFNQLADLVRNDEEKPK